jgi:cysteine-rich repeat protein
MQLIKLKLKKISRGVGYVESLIAIGIAGILLVAVGLLIVRVQRTTVQNELEDEATQQVALYLDLARAIKDNAWSTKTGLPPDLAVYDICYNTTTGYYFCDPAFSANEVVAFGGEFFDHKLDLIIHPTSNLVEVVATVECKEGKCDTVSYTESEALALNVLPIIGGSTANCGNAITEGSEECDDGDNNDDNACSNLCVLNPVCGNASIDGGEECDDGNGVDTDACDNDCQSNSPVCGNGIIEGSEECDQGSNNGAGTCSTTCTLERVVLVTVTQGDCGSISCPVANPYPVKCQFIFQNTGPKAIKVYWKIGSRGFTYKQGDACTNRGTEKVNLWCSNVDENIILAPSNCPSTRPLKFIYL